MQAVSVLPFAEFSGKFEHEFAAKLRIYDENGKNENGESHEEEHEDNHEEEEHEDNHEGEYEYEEEEEFSFMFANPDGSPVSADDIFDNGQIRPVFPIFDQTLLFSDDYEGGEIIRPPVKKLFVQKKEESPSSSSSSTVASAADPEGPYCAWSPKTAVKSNSTGFSKIWKLRHDKLRSNSDGKDAFVFLNAPSSTAAVKTEKVRSGEGNKVNGAVTKVNNNKVVKGKTTSSSSSAHEKHYVMNRARKEGDKRKSYLPYKQELFGFFASSNGLSRNVHPY